MSRYCYNGTVRDENGPIVSNATIVVYEADTTTTATIYEAKSGGTAISGASLTSGSDGTYKFYVDDADYVSGDQFDIKATKTGYASQTKEDVTVF